MTDRADLTAERADAPMHGRELVDDWIERLRQQLIQLEHDHRDLDAELDLWQAGSRPRELRDAIARRSNHLAYTAIVSQEAWVAHLAERWGNRPTPGDVLGLHALVVLTAAHRERASHHGDQHEDLKLLVDYRDQLHHERTRVCNRLHADLAIAYPGYQRGIGKALTSRRSLNKVDELLAADHSVRADLDRQRLARLREIDAELKQVVIQLEVLIEASGSTLVDIVGISTVVAARLLGEVGDTRRFPTSSAFAAGNGTAPLDVSSGRNEHHRLNRGGNRRINRALYTIAITQTRHEPRAADYLARKRSSGHTRRGALRCLKRRLSDVIYRTMLEDAAGLDT